VPFFLKFKLKEKKFVFPLEFDQIYFVGRSSKCDIHLPDSSISNMHAEISFDKNKEIRIKDLNSTNGIYINQEKIDRSTKHFYPGDLVKIGDAEVAIDEKRNTNTVLINLREISDKKVDKVKKNNKVTNPGQTDFDSVLDVSDSRVDTSNLTLERQIEYSNGNSTNTKIAPEKALTNKDKILLEIKRKIVS
jgi:pSer/pThr/pTyr-binding forkhead associated (FHA) protein